VDRRNDPPDPGETGNPYDATDATERREDRGTFREEGMAGAIGAGSPQDIPRETLGTRGSVRQTVGIGRSTETGSYAFPAYTAASVCRRARRTCSSERRWTPRAGAST
jgi:hypothetical protein